MRIIAIDDAIDVITVHYEDGSKDVYNDWGAFISKVDLGDVETYNDIMGDYYHQNGVVPLTAYPESDPTNTRPPGQGCKTCRFFSGCLATEQLRGDRQKLTDRTGTACTSYEAGS